MKKPIDRSHYNNKFYQIIVSLIDIHTFPNIFNPIISILPSTLTCLNIVINFSFETWVIL